MDFKIRTLLKDEERLLDFLIKMASISISKDWHKDLFVRQMDDGGMGSLRLFPHGVIDEDRIFGEQISEYIFEDEDGIKVIASLNVDEENNLFELDIWKTDYSPLIKIPNIIS
ncbi:DUF6984 family protein [Flavobacterium sp. UBA4197]|uniref:DUF6984 family protein n=1 Tax=Flavobacterium sp. UBA4197 TaxID=1946546 RepID=UPI0025799791|nr:hypothetical protein [Flavobacterium sp. UBA4197]